MLSRPGREVGADGSVGRVPLLRLAAQSAMLDTGWCSQYTFEEALGDYLKWLSEHPYWAVRTRLRACVSRVNM